MPTDQEKNAFAKRLRLALNRASEPVKGATDLALRFNLRHHAGPSISPQTAHKWLSGRSIPTKEKLATLSKWLDCNEHWLQYGPAPVRPSPRAEKEVSPTPPGKAPPSAASIELARRIENLPLHARYVLEEMVSLLQPNTET
ncbi:MAG: transcriptional regulator [Janthinobacterium lividum]